LTGVEKGDVKETLKGVTSVTNRRLELPQELRLRAEEKTFLDEATTLQTSSPEEVKSLLHDLRVHQIELVAQLEELHLAHAELEASRSRYFDLYDLAPVGYCTLSKDGFIKVVNLAFATMFGMARTVLINRLLSRFIFPEDQNIYYRHIKKLFEINEVQSWEMRMVRADGFMFWVHLQCTLMLGGECWITLNDISERKKAEEEKVALDHQLLQAHKLESLGVLAGGIAHDFNNSLGIILGNCYLAKLDPEGAEGYITTIEKSANHSAELCRQMLEYAGKSLLVTNQVDMTTVVRDKVRTLKAAIPQNVVIKLDCTDTPLIGGDASLLGQIVMNLIVNASEAIGEAQGEIRVSLATTEIRAGFSDKDHLGRIIPAGVYVCLEISDTGCGMDDEIKRRIFEPFYTTKFTGRGLGLSAALGIILSHQGALQLFSQPGKGTTIKIYLPVYKEAPEEESDQQASFAPWQGSGTVLLVDDEEHVIFVAKTMLEELGFSVIDASNGKEALELYRMNAEKITLVVTDIGMPVMDGYALFSELKKINPELPIIISSGFSDTVVTLRIAVENIAGFISKPYSFEQLRDALKSVVGSCH